MVRDTIAAPISSKMLTMASDDFQTDISEQEFISLPRKAQIALAARCAQRVVGPSAPLDHADLC
jgi:hypothetical protein